MAFPTKDELLADFSLNFGTKISADPEDYGTTALIAAEFETKRLAFLNKFNAVKAARDQGILNRQLIADKDSLKKDLLKFGRGLYAAIQFNGAVSDALKIAAGVHVRPTHNVPRPPPAFAPGAEVTSVNGRLVNVRVFDTQDLTSKARPAGTIGCMILSHIGPTPPENVRDWTLEGPTGDLTTSVLFPEGTEAGTKVFITCYWFNERKASGPALWPPVSATIGYASSMPTEDAA